MSYRIVAQVDYFLRLFRCLPGLSLLLFIFISLTELNSGSSSELHLIWERCADGQVYGYINRKGKVVIKPGWNWAGSFSKGGIAAVEGGYYPYPYYPSIECDCYDYTSGGGFGGSGTIFFKYRLINKRGKYINRRVWGKTYGFYDGMASM